MSAPGRSSAWREWLAWVAGAAVLVAIAYMVDGYTADLYRKLLLFISLALAFNFLFGVAGQVAFSQIAFYGLGAYSITILWAVYHWPFLLALAATIVICTLIALAVAIPTNRLEGFYLALATLAFSQFFVVMLAQGGSFTGGPSGLSGFKSPEILGVVLDGRNYIFVVIALVLGTLAVLRNVDRSYFGRACRAIRDNPEAAAAMGVNVARTRIIVFTLTSALSAVAGVCYAFADNYVNPNVFGLNDMFILFFMVIIGGTGRHAGAIIGATVLFLLPELLGDLIGRRHLLLYGVFVVLAILFWPKGLVGILDAAWARISARRAGA
ncbi:MAG TPA: branched-chain amino acid ABC transporter permease [Alphaproteobacteria bacterium]